MSSQWRVEEIEAERVLQLIRAYIDVVEEAAQMASVDDLKTAESAARSLLKAERYYQAGDFGKAVFAWLDVDALAIYRIAGRNMAGAPLRNYHAQATPQKRRRRRGTEYDDADREVARACENRIAAGLAPKNAIADTAAEFKCSQATVNRHRRRNAILDELARRRSKLSR